MALGFIKKVFTFGKDKPVQAVEKPHDEVTAEDVLAEAEAVAILDTSEAAPREASDTTSAEEATTPSVPSGHLPHEGGDQPEDVASSEHQASEPQTP
jgi:fused signal recognition particle receptor